MIRCKRVYDAVEDEDGQRVLVDRLWPRNKRKEDLHGQWLREVAPSNELRKAFHQGDVACCIATMLYRGNRRILGLFWAFFCVLPIVDGKRLTARLARACKTFQTSAHF